MSETTPRDQQHREPSHQHPEDMTRADKRWDISGLRDWIVLAVMVVLYSAFCLSLFLLEPGIR